MFRRKLVFIALTISLSLMISGCATDPFQGAYAARVDEVDIPKNFFRYGEAPCVVIIGYNGTITGEIKRLNDDRLVHRWTDYVPNKHGQRLFFLSDIPPGSYECLIHFGGSVVERFDFKIER